MQVAAELFDEIMVAPHLDDGLKRGKWRNMLHFDPLWEDPQGYSYWKTMLQPILEAANEVLDGSKTFWFAVEGRWQCVRRTAVRVQCVVQDPCANMKSSELGCCLC